ncbi:MAG: PAS domain-containing protein [Ruminococcus sp.]
MEQFFKSIIDTDIMPVVICDVNHTIIYMNPAAAENYSKRGGYALIGKSLLDCHNEESNNMIKRVAEWFKKDKCNNRVFTFHNPKQNKDVYMIALRDEKGELIGYYEKHESRIAETDTAYDKVK